MRVQFVLSEMGIGLRRNLTMTIAVIVTVAISLALFGSALLINKQVDAMKDFWYDKVEVSVYLCGESSQTLTCGGGAVTPEQRSELQADLESMPQVQQVFYESQEQAYAQFREQFKDSPDLVQSVSEDALPESFRVKLRDPTQFEVIASAFSGRPGVEEVQDQRKLLNGFFNALETLRDFAIGIAVVQLLAALLLISNTIRVAAFNRRRETGIMRLVGASNLFIRLPFLLEGVLAAVIGALLASLTLVAAQRVIIEGLFLRGGGLRDNFPIIAYIDDSDVLLTLPWLFATGIVLAGLSSFITLQRHLRV
jgi:cell division transport system permease protein